MTKKAQWQIVLNPIGLTIIVILLIVLFIPFVGLGIFLAFNLLTVLGIVLIVMAALAITKGIINHGTWCLLIGGFVLLLLPYLSKTIASLSIGSVFG